MVKEFVCLYDLLVIVVLTPSKHLNYLTNNNYVVNLNVIPELILTHVCEKFLNPTPIIVAQNF